MLLNPNTNPLETLYFIAVPELHLGPAATFAVLAISVGLVRNHGCARSNVEQGNSLLMFTLQMCYLL